jgi:hypothetical protein
MSRNEEDIPKGPENELESNQFVPPREKDG